ncbi:MAG: HdeD family acid-resistance protein [Alphaproteobacteria bacterium]|nr:HdeD family acid-resistance protein [Alphaproteobacteria bacterium]
MTDLNLPNIDEVRRRFASAFHAHWKLFLAEGAVMMVLGLLAIAVPEVASLAITILIGWLFFVGGIFRTISLLQHRNMPGFGWSLATALLAIALGLILLLRPIAGVLTLTIALVIFFILEGVSAILLAIEHRRHLPSWGWVLFSGLVDLLLAFLIWDGWPSSAGWAIGLLVGINMVFLGLSLIMTALAARTMAPKT